MTTRASLSTTQAPSAQDDVLAAGTDVGRVYGRGPTAVTAVEHASFSVQRGNCIAVTGTSGSGKSTLLHLVAGLETPTSGRLRWPALGPVEALRPGPVAVIFQGPSLLPPLTVQENVALPLLLAGTGEREATARARGALRDLDLLDLADKLPEEISGGQAQRVAITRALAGDPQLILADEPTGQLDSLTGQHVAAALVAAAASTGAALLLTTHDPAVLALLPQRWTMEDGRLAPATYRRLPEGGQAPGNAVHARDESC